MKAASIRDAHHLTLSSATGPARPVFFMARLVLALCLLLITDVSAGLDLVTENPYKVEAAFLRNFAHYVTWPAEAFGDAGSPWRICVLGNDPFGRVLEATLKGRTEQGRSFQVFRADSLDALPACQIIYVAFADPGRRRAILRQLRDKPVLTVGEASEFLQEGGIIRLQQRETVQMSVNLDHAREAELTIQTRMLEVAFEVVKNGQLRKAR